MQCFKGLVRINFMTECLPGGCLNFAGVRAEAEGRWLLNGGALVANEGHGITFLKIAASYSKVCAFDVAE